MKDNTVTIHPTVRLSTAYILSLKAEKENTSIGRVIEKILSKDKELQEIKQKHFYNKKS